MIDRYSNNDFLVSFYVTALLNAVHEPDLLVSFVPGNVSNIVQMTFFSRHHSKVNNCDHHCAVVIEEEDPSSQE